MFMIDRIKTIYSFAETKQVKYGVSGNWGEPKAVLFLHCRLNFLFQRITFTHSKNILRANASAFSMELCQWAQLFFAAVCYFECKNALFLTSWHSSLLNANKETNVHTQKINNEINKVVKEISLWRNCSCYTSSILEFWIFTLSLELRYRKHANQANG